LDPEFKATVDVIRQGVFGYEDFFSDVLDSITHGSDYYLLANDFQSYIKAQVSSMFLTVYDCSDQQPPCMFSRDHVDMHTVRDAQDQSYVGLCTYFSAIIIQTKPSLQQMMMYC